MDLRLRQLAHLDPLAVAAPGVPMMFMGQEMLEHAKLVAEPAPLGRATTSAFDFGRRYPQRSYREGGDA